MSQYLVLIYGNEAWFADASPEDQAQLHKEHQEFGERHGPVIIGGNALHPTSTATSIRPEPGGGHTVTDGAFAETKEALGGYYLVEAADLDQAVAIARDVPARSGGVEVRPVWDVM